MEIQLPAGNGSQQFKIQTDDILARVDEWNIYSRYYQSITGKPPRIGINRSIFKKTDSSPSLSFYRRNMRIKFKCHATGLQGDVFDFVQHACQLKTLQEVCGDINDTFILGLRPDQQPVPLNFLPRVVDSLIDDYNKSFIHAQKDWDSEGLYFWKRFGVTRETLNIFKTIQISYLSGYSNAGKKMTRWEQPEKPLFCYDKGNGYVKYYCPGQEPKLINCGPSGVFGLTQYLESGCKTGFIYAGEKDLHAGWSAGFPGFCFNSENSRPNIEVMNELKASNHELAFIYDPDPAGIKFSDLYSQEFSCKNHTHLLLPFGKEFDVACFIEHYGTQKFTSLFE